MRGAPKMRGVPSAEPVYTKRWPVEWAGEK